MANIKVLYSEIEIAERVRQLGKEITDHYQGKQILVLGVLKGSFIFMADLVRAINLPIKCEFIRVSSYRGATKAGQLEFVTDIAPEKVQHQHILLVEDIIDTGNTMAFLLDHLAQYQPASIQVCTLLLKKEMLTKSVQMDYIGFSIPSLFVVGYGLDVKELYRNYPAIGVWEES